MGEPGGGDGGPVRREVGIRRRGGRRALVAGRAAFGLDPRDDAAEPERVGAAGGGARRTELAL
jgi:hypothetical protein